VKRERVVSVAVVVAVMLASVFAVRFFVGPRLTVVTAVVGSENKPFFDDQRVKQFFARHGLQLKVDFEGSRLMATADNTCRYDLALPSSEPAADKVKVGCHVPTSYPAFSSPMVVVTFGDIIPLLQQLDIATQDATTKIWSFNVEKYLEAVIRGLRWNQIPNNSTYPSSNKFLLTSTDPRYSNSAAMYVGMVSYVLNKNTPVSDPQEVHDLGQLIGQKLFLDQGYTSDTSQPPFEDYLGSLGESLARMTLVYEAQFVDVKLNQPTLVTDRHLVVMYPTPTAVANHTAVSLTPLGDRVRQLLDGTDYDQDIIRLEAEHGFRTRDTQDTFTMITKTHGITVPEQLDVAPLPTYENLEGLLNEIEKMYGH
jgi:hypothetical protein